MFQVPVFVLRDRFGWTAARVGALFVGTTFVTGVNAAHGVPRVVGRLGIGATVSAAGGGQLVMCALLAMPWAYGGGGGRMTTTGDDRRPAAGAAALFVGLFLCLVITFQFSHAPNQARAKLIIGERRIGRGGGYSRPGEEAQS